MPTFEDREKSFESAFAREEELRFKAAVRRNRALAAWASGLLGHDGAATAAYAEAMSGLALRADADAATRARLEADLAPLGEKASAHRIGRRMDSEFAAALAALKAGD